MPKSYWGPRIFAGVLVFCVAVISSFAEFRANFAQAAEESAALVAPVPASSEELPQVLSSSDAQLYRKIFALQDKGKWKKADELIAQLDDKRLMGHVLEQRYMHPTAYRSKYKELKDWMGNYADHPGARRVYRLATKRRPANYSRPKKPIVSRLSGAAPKSYTYRSAKKRTKAQRSRVASIKRQIRRNILNSRFTVTEKLLATPEVKKLFDKVELDWGYAQVASGWFYYGKPEKAFALVGPAGRRSGDKVPIAQWIAGLSAWRTGRIEEAAWHFDALGNSENASDWLVSAGAYWASRAYTRLQQPEKVSAMLRLATERKRTFYGLLAASALGQEIEFDFGRPRIDEVLLARLEARPAASRALGLIQVGQRDRAEQELLRFGRLHDADEAEALLVLAEKAGMPNIAFKIGNWLFYSEDRFADAQAVDAALYPIPPWQPTGGFEMDRALIYAFMRRESAFNPRAKSRVGARGLMQLMPRTANYIAPGNGYHRGSQRNALFEPSLNLTLGQRYVTYLLGQNAVNGDLFRLATAYNGGPGNLAKWERKVQAGDDPLYFIESLPSRETRLFIEHVLANFWIYRQRLGQDTPSRDQAASNEWPLYLPLDDERSEVAKNAAN